MCGGAARLVTHTAGGRVCCLSVCVRVRSGCARAAAQKRSLAELAQKSKEADGNDVGGDAELLRLRCSL